MKMHGRIIAFLSLILSAGASSSQAQTCEAFPMLRQMTPMHIGVYFRTANPRFIKATTRALEYWSAIASMDWYLDNTNSCQITVVEQLIMPKHPGLLTTGRADLPQLEEFRGFLRWNNDSEVLRLSDDHLLRVAIHELGHVLGLNHNRRRSSIMYWLSESDQQLLPSDVDELARLHQLRPAGLLEYSSYFGDRLQQPGLSRLLSVVIRSQPIAR